MTPAAWARLWYAWNAEAETLAAENDPSAHFYRSAAAAVARHRLAAPEAAQNGRKRVRAAAPQRGRPRRMAGRAWKRRQPRSEARPYVCGTSRRRSSLTMAGRERRAAAVASRGDPDFRACRDPDPDGRCRGSLGADFNRLRRAAPPPQSLGVQIWDTVPTAAEFCKPPVDGRD